ncbi:Protein of unknown function [Pyronema omphalodes CBS 100304]|uniref:Uncharacterized protein n=1 Tax=Pyronema omphalodes (strain CBS 100304) TaxID=1076935 RepID=U4L9C7_PYROM|nr:Protein of unknown function [Pyronema omphalodes CBS 100304]
MKLVGLVSTCSNLRGLILYTQ